MQVTFFRQILISILYFCIFHLFTLSAMQISSEESIRIGQGIYFNECGKNEKRLVCWNEGENFASLGIGHFIWYPENVIRVFEETFPALVSFLQENDVQLPLWLTTKENCPWNEKHMFLADMNKRKELRKLLSCTIALQVMFIVKRFESAIPKILNSFQEEKKMCVSQLLFQLENSYAGKFALLDYLNFKGDGTAETEKYKGKGWGLKQVLEEMSEKTEDPLSAFKTAAKYVLCQRVQAAPPERHEERWLKGWLARIDRY